MPTNTITLSPNVIFVPFNELKIQKRIHKKKRINKKWAKRYGFISIPIVIPGFRLEEGIDSNTIVFFNGKEK